MKKRWVVLAGVGGLVVGAIATFAAMMYFGGLFMSYAAYARGIADGTVQLASLNALRSGDQARAIRTLAQSLEATVLMLDASSHELSQSQQEKKHALFEKVRDYRRAHDAHNPDARFDARIDEILSETISQ